MYIPTFKAKAPIVGFYFSTSIFVEQKCSAKRKVKNQKKIENYSLEPSMVPFRFHFPKILIIQWFTILLTIILMISLQNFNKLF